MNKWKIAFWITLTVLLFTIGFSLYSMADQAVALTHLSDSFSKTQSDLDDVSRIINDTNLSQREVRKILKEHSAFESIDLDKNRVSLQTVTLVFKDGKLMEIRDLQ